MKKAQALMVAGGLTLSLALAGCGGGGDEAEAAEAISQAMVEDSGSEFAVDEEQADCVGEGLVDELGVDKLQEYGIVTEDLTVEQSVTNANVTMEEQDADNAAGVIVGCIDTQTILAEELSAGGDMSEEQQECIGEALDDEALTTMFSLIFQGKEDEATQDLMGPLMSCMLG